MARIYLVRHGEASATWSEAHDPGLSERGRDQADAVARRFADGEQMTVISSPLLRTRETARPLAALWGIDPIIDPRFAEIPTADGIGLADRGPWLRNFMAGRWRDAPADLQTWRALVIEGLTGLQDHSVVFTHFVAINVAAGAATGQDAVTCFSPANGSVSAIEVSGGKLLLSALGAQMPLPV